MRIRTIFGLPVLRLSLLTAMLAFVGWQFGGCEYRITGPPQGGSSGTAGIVMSVSPGSATIATGNSLSVTAKVQKYAKDSTVTWSIVGEQSGSVTATANTATYTAASSLPRSMVFVTLRATSREDSTVHAECLITVRDTNIGHPNQDVNIALNPLEVTLQGGGSQQFTATVSGSTNTAVTWKLVSGQGVLTATGLYTAPASVTVHSTAVVQATAAADTSKWVQATVTLMPPVDTTPCFSRDVLPIFVSNCAMSGCHNPTDRQEGYDLTSYAGVMRGIRAGSASSSKLYRQITSGEMPPYPNPKLNADQKKTIADWINAGAKNGDCSAPSGSGCDTSSVHYASYVRGLISNNCLGCHSPSTAANSGGIDLSTWNGVHAVAENGRLFGAVSHAPGYSAMPQGGLKLDDCTVAKVKAWINRGSPND